MSGSGAARPSVHDWISLWVLRFAKRKRLKWRKQAEVDFYADFFKDDDVVECERDIRRLLRNREVERVLEGAPEGSLVVDVGCGVGDALRSVPGRYRRIGLDYSVSSLERAKGALDGRGALVAGTATNLPFRSDSVDVVICLEVLEHLENDARAVAEVARVLKRGGLLVASVPNAYYFRDYLALMGHWRHYSPASLSDLLGQGGLAVDRHLASYPRFSRWYFYVYCALWALNRASNLLFRRSTSLYDMRLPGCRAPLYETLLPLFKAASEREAATTPDSRGGTFVGAVKQ